MSRKKIVKPGITKESLAKALDKAQRQLLKYEEQLQGLSTDFNALAIEAGKSQMACNMLTEWIERSLGRKPPTIEFRTVMKNGKPGLEARFADDGGVVMDPKITGGKKVTQTKGGILVVGNGGQ